jgi:alpha-L-fucosidase
MALDDDPETRWATDSGTHEAWLEVDLGKRIGEECLLRFDPITTAVVRLNILSATEGPTIWEFQLFPPDKK